MRFVYSLVLLLLAMLPIHAQAGMLTCSEALHLFQQSSRSHITQSPFQDLEWSPERLQNTIRWFVESIDPEKLVYSRADLNKFLLYPSFSLEEEVLKLVEKKDCSLFKKIHALKPQLLSEIVNELAWDELRPETVRSWELNGSRPEHLVHLEENRQGILRRWREKLVDGIRFQTASMHLSEADAFKLALRRFKQKLAEMEKIDLESTPDHLLNAFFKTLDVHSRYICQEEVERRKKMGESGYEGVGILFQEALEGIYVTRIFENGPAFREGILKTGDIITEIDGISLDGKTMTEVMQLLRGPVGTQVHIHIQRSREALDVLATRGKVDQSEALLEKNLNTLDETRVGYIMVPTFSAEGVAKRFREAVDHLKDEGIEALVVDLRDNMGGNPAEMAGMVDYIIDGDVMFMQKFNLGDPVATLDSIDGPPAFDGPLVILVNERTASAAEAFAGIIKAYQRGVVVGSPRTFGKGTSQSSKNLTVVKNQNGIQRLRARGMFWITEDYYYLPDGTSAQYRGITSDIVIDKACVKNAVLEEMIPGSLHAPQIVDSEMDAGQFHFTGLDAIIETLNRASRRRQENKERSIRREALLVARDWVQNQRHEDSLASARERCYGPPEDGEVLYKDVWGDWDFNRKEMAVLFDRLYGSPARLESRLYYKPETGEFVLPVKNMDGDWTTIRVSDNFIKALISHIEKAHANGWARYVMLADMGHGHFMVPVDASEELNHSGLEDVLNHPGTKVLYHTGEMLNFYVFSSRMCVDDPYVNFRRENRNLLGYLDGSGEVDVLQEPSDQAFNLVRVAPGHRRFLDFEFSGNNNGCFSYRDNEGQIRYFDVNYCGTPQRPPE
jgi:carboxyl-terminal processing protease